jgi:hypothetical protein
MKKHLAYFTGVVWLAALAVGAAPFEPGLVAQIHFAGGAAVAADPNSGVLKNLWASPEALALRGQTLKKLSLSLDGWLRRQVAPTLTAPVSLAPLLEDLGQSEWQLDLHQPTADTVELALAVRLDNTRAQAWQTTLAPVLQTWKMTSPQHHGYLTRNGTWLLLTLGNSPAPKPAGVITDLKGNWLAAEMDWGRLAVWYPEWRKLDLPKTRLEVVGRNGNFEVNGKLFLAQPLPALGPWQFPTNTIHSPFVSFTAARGISSWLRQQPWAVAIGLQSLPDQVFTWALPEPGGQSAAMMPICQAYAAVPMAAAPTELPKLERSLTAALHDGPPDSAYQKFNVQEVNHQAVVTGMPFLAPYLEADREASGEFLVGGFFPNPPRGKVAPPELFARLGEPGLVFYHWEITSERMKSFPPLYQSLLVGTRHYQLDAASAAGKWLEHLTPTLGPTVTQGFATAPNEITFSRKAPAGLTSLELVALASWLEAPNFPGCDLRMPVPKPRRHAPPSGGAAAPFILH